MSQSIKCGYPEGTRGIAAGRMIIPCPTRVNPQANEDKRIRPAAADSPFGSPAKDFPALLPVFGGSLSKPFGLIRFRQNPAPAYFNLFLIRFSPPCPIFASGRTLPVRPFTRHHMKTIVMKSHLLLLFGAVSVLLSACGTARSSELPELSTDDFRDGINHWNMDHPERSYRRYDPSEVRGIAANILAYQNEDGGWPKNLDLLAVIDPDSVKQALSPRYRESTLDNSNTFPQIEYLAQMYSLTSEEPYREGAEKGIEYLFNLQNASGGWRGWDVDAITFNDEVTTGAMGVMHKVMNKSFPYDWVDDLTAIRAAGSFQRALDVTIACQIVVNGTKTAWCQQHDHVTLEPVKARSYELPSITAGESADVALFLMGLPDPDPRVVEAVKAAVRWFEKSKLQGIRMVRVPIPQDSILNHAYPYDQVIVEDPDAPPIWARFYELSPRVIPFMCNRNGIKVYRLEDVAYERRVGYAWYGYWPQKVLDAYPEWLERIENRN